MQARFCSECGAPLRPQSKFCKICGSPVYVADTDTPDSEIPKNTSAPIVCSDPSENTAAVPEQTQNPSDNPIQFIPPDGNSVPTPKHKQSASVCRRGAGTIILAVIICLFIFIWTLGAVSLTDIRISLSGENIEKTLGSVLNTSQLMQTPAHYIFPGTSDKSQTIVDWAVEELEAAYGNSIDITVEMAEDLLNDSTLLPFVIQELSDFVLDIRDSTGQSGISSAELQEFIEENLDEIGAISGEELTSNDSHYIAGLLENQGVLEYLDVQNLKESSPTVFNIIKLGLSYWAIGLFCLLSVLFLMLLAKCNRWNFWHTCGDFGIVLTTQSGLLLLATAVSAWLPDIWCYVCGANDLLSNLTATVLKNCCLFHAVILATGVLLRTIKLIWKKVCQRRTRH